MAIESIQLPPEFNAPSPTARRSTLHSVLCIHVLRHNHPHLPLCAASDTVRNGTGAKVLRNGETQPASTARSKPMLARAGWAHKSGHLCCMFHRRQDHRIRIQRLHRSPVGCRVWSAERRPAEWPHNLGALPGILAGSSHQDPATPPFACGMQRPGYREESFPAMLISGVVVNLVFSSVGKKILASVVEAC